MIIGDESTFETGQRAREFVTRRPWEKYRPDCIDNYKHSGRKSDMVWGAICSIQDTHLREMKTTAKQTRRGKTIESMASIDYIDQILGPCFEPWCRALEKDVRRPIYMQDGASIHSSAEVCLWLRSHKIEVMEWPLTSPDLNPTENMWKASKGKVRRYPRLITNEKDMFEAASREWEGLLERKKHVQEISTMKDRCKAGIKNRGFATGY